jgi:hypothetical protein
MKKTNEKWTWEIAYKKWFFLRFFLLLLALALTITLAYITFCNKNKTEDYPYESTPVVKHTIDTSSWKTYTSQLFGFQFKYPSDWIQEPNDNTDPTTFYYVSFMTPKRQTEMKAYESKYDRYYPGRTSHFSVVVSPVSQKLVDGQGNRVSLEAWVKGTVNSNPNPIIPVTIDGVKGYKNGYIDESEGEAIFLVKNDEVYTIDFEGSISKEEEALLSTFKFTK